MFKAKVKVNPAIQNNYVTTATNLVILQEIVGSTKGSSKGTSKGKGKMGAKSSKGTSKGKTGKNHAAEGTRS